MSSPLRIERFGTPARFLTITALAGSPLLAQEVLTLRQAVDLALHSNPFAAASDAGKKAESRIDQSRSGYLPRLQFSESLQRGNNPVFVFSSLLTQHQFSDANFAIGSLDRPDAMNNYQSQSDGRAGSIRCAANGAVSRQRASPAKRCRQIST